MQKGYGNLRLWLWSLLPVIYVALQIMMVQRMDYLLVSNYPAFGTEFQALYNVPIDPFFDKIFAISKGDNTVVAMERGGSSLPDHVPPVEERILPTWGRDPSDRVPRRLVREPSCSHDAAREMVGAGGSSL